MRVVSSRRVFAAASAVRRVCAKEREADSRSAFWRVRSAFFDLRVSCRRC